MGYGQGEELSESGVWLTQASLESHMSERHLEHVYKSRLRNAWMMRLERQPPCCFEVFVHCVCLD